MNKEMADVRKLDTQLPADQLLSMACGHASIIMTTDPINVIDQINDCHNSFEFFLPLTNVPSFYVEELKLSCRSGQLIVINPHQKHGVQRPVRNASFISILYPCEYLHNLIHRTTREAVHEFPNKVSLLQPEIQLLMAQLTQEYRESKIGREILLNVLSEQLAVHLIRHYYGSGLELNEPTADTFNDNQKRFVPVLNDMQENLSEKLTIDHLAALALMNRFHFIRSFRQAFGASPYEYLTAMRIDYARNLLKNSDLSASDVATRCGFFSASRFSAAFRQLTGMTPSHYRLLSKREKQLNDNLVASVQAATHNMVFTHDLDVE